MSDYRRILLKISGEQLAGGADGGIDPKVADWLAEEIAPLQEAGKEIVIMVGGGNFVRGANLAGHGIQRVTADHMGMLGTMINALAVTDIFESKNVKTRCLTTIFASQVAEPFVHRLANKHLQKGRVVIVGGGSGRPYVTTDTAALVLALELGCEVVLKATKVDGVYDKDPEKHEDVTKFDSLTFKEALENVDVRVMDQAALALAMDYELPIVVYNFTQKGALAGILKGEKIGTTIS